MPITFNPNDVVNPDPYIREANAYQGLLDYATNRMDAGGLAVLNAQLAAAGLPTDASLILSMPNPYHLVDGARTLIMRAVSSQPIDSATNVTAAIENVAGDLVVDGALSVTGTTTVGGNLAVSGSVTAGNVIAGLGAGTLTGTVFGGIGLFNGGLHVGPNSSADNFAESLNDGESLTVEGHIETGLLVMSAPVADPYALTNPGRSFGESQTGDIFWKSTGIGSGANLNGSGTITYCNRPIADTGWINIADASIGRTATIGALGSFDLPDLYNELLDPSFTTPADRINKFYYTANPALAADRQERGPGSEFGPVRQDIWLALRGRRDLLGLPANPFLDVFVQLYPYRDATGALGGAMLIGDNLVGSAYLLIGDNELLPGFPAVDPNDVTIQPDLEIRAMYFRRGGQPRL